MRVYNPAFFFAIGRRIIGKIARIIAWCGEAKTHSFYLGP